MVDPERDPRQHDDEHRRQVVLEQEEADVAFQLEAQRQPLITACHAAHRTVQPQIVRRYSAWSVTVCTVPAGGVATGRRRGGGP